MAQGIPQSNTPNHVRKHQGHKSLKPLDASCVALNSEAKDSHSSCCSPYKAVNSTWLTEPLLKVAYLL